MKKILYTLITICAFAINSFAQSPAISSFSPASGSIGTLVTITGTNLSNIDTVKIGGVAAIKISATSTTLVAMVMPGSTSGNIYLTNSSGSNTSSSNFNKINYFSPNTQQGNKLVGTGFIGASSQGNSVSLSADGNTAIVGGRYDSTNIGSAWIFTRTGNTWTQQGNKLVGTGSVGAPRQGSSVGLSADGNTAIVGGWGDNNSIGASWIFTRTGNTWTQQGNKLVGTGFIGASSQGNSVSLSADGNTAIIGGSGDNNNRGSSWIFTRTGNTWTQQGNKLVGTGFVGGAIYQGTSVSLSADGNTAIIGGYGDSSFKGASWIFTRSGNNWTQQGNKLVGTGSVGSTIRQGESVSISADGNTAIIGGSIDNSRIGASWIFSRTGNTWTQQGNKLVGTGYVSSIIEQGQSVSISADGNTAIIGGAGDNGGLGAAWIFNRTSTTWSQKGDKLVGTVSVGSINYLGESVSISADGNTAIIGAPDAGSSGLPGSAFVFNGIPKIYTTSNMIGFNSCPGVFSNTQSFNVSGVVNNNDSLFISAPVGFEISASNVSGFASSLKLTSISGIIISTTIYVRLTSIAFGSPIGNIVCSAPNAISQNISVSGIVRPKPIVGFSINNVNQCLNNNSFLFNDTSTISSGTYARKWNLGLGVNDSSLLSNPSRVYLTENTYNIKLLATSDQGCKDSIIKSITLKPKPIVGFIINNPIQCLNGNNFLFNDTSTISSGTYTRKWNLGLGVNDSSLLSNPNRVYLNANTYNIKLLAISNYGCKDSIIKSITINPNLKIGFTINNRFQCLNGNNFLFNDTSSITTGTYFRKWNLGLGVNDSSLLSNPSRVYLTENTYSIKLLTINNFGCKDSVIKSITVRPKPNVGFIINKPIQCLNGNNFLFNDTSTISSGTYARKWNLGLGVNDSSLLSNPSRVYLTENTYNIKLLATSDYGCKDSIIKSITVNPKPIVGFSINKVNQCLSNNSFLFNDTSIISSGNIAKRLWKLSSNDTSSNSSFNKVYTVAGAYTIKLIEESNNGCKDSLTKNISVTNLIASTSTTKSNICSAGGNGSATIYLENGTSPYTYLWGSNANSQNTPIASGLKEDTYQVIATDANNCNITKSIKVLNTPNVNTQVPITNIAMLDQSNAANFSQYYNYDLPLSINPNSNNPKNYADAGKYFRFKIQTKNSKLNGQSIVNGFCKVRSNSPYVTITDSIAALNNIAYNGKVWSADEFEVYINPTTPKGSNLYLDFVVEESATSFSTGCLSIPIAPLNYSTNTALTIDDDNNPDSKGNNNDTCELAETIEFYPWLNNVSNKKAQYVKGTLLNNNNFAGVNIWNNIKGVNDTVMNNTWWNLAFGKPTSIDTGSIESKPAMDFVFDYSYGAPRNNFDLNLAVAAGFNLLSDTTLSLVQWSLPYNFKSEVGAADALQVNPQSLSYTSLTSSKKVAITSNRSWVVTSNQSWVNSKSTGIGNDSINITVAANTGLPRTALLTFTAGLITKTLTINQDSFTTADILSLDKDSINTSFGASLNTVQLSSNRSWTVSSNQSWCGVSTVTGSGNGSFNVINTINNTGLFRSALVTVTAGSITKNVYVAQSASVGINNPIINNQQISLYPNPNNGNFTIQLKNTSDKNGTITIVDMLGRTVYETIYKLNGNEDIISISQLHLKAGTYNITIGNKDGAAARKSFVVIGE